MNSCCQWGWPPRRRRQFARYALCINFDGWGPVESHLLVAAKFHCCLPWRTHVRRSVLFSSVVRWQLQISCQLPNYTLKRGLAGQNHKNCQSFHGFSTTTMKTKFTLRIWQYLPFLKLILCCAGYTTCRISGCWSVRVITNGFVINLDENLGSYGEWKVIGAWITI